MERDNERRGVAAGLARVVTGLAARLLGSPASARLGVLEPGEPVRLAGARLNPGRRGVLAMAMVTALTVLVAGGWVLAAGPHPMLAAGVHAGRCAGRALPGPRRPRWSRLVR